MPDGASGSPANSGGGNAADHNGEAGSAGSGEDALSAGAGGAAPRPAGEGGNGGQTPDEEPIDEARGPLECSGFATGESYAMPNGEIVPRASGCSATNCTKFSGAEKQLCCDVTAQLRAGCSSYDEQQFNAIEDYCHWAVLYNACLQANPLACACASDVRTCQAVATTTPPLGICADLASRSELVPGPAIYVSKFVLDPTDDIATDPVSGLVWQRTLVKNASSTNGLYTLAAAQAFCSSIDLPGQGWRVPTREEALTIVQGQAPPYVNAVVFPSTPASKFWTTSTVTSQPPLNYYVIDHASGKAVIGGVPDNSFSIRCVRGA